MDQSVIAKAYAYYSNGISTSTHRTYASGVKNFLFFCQQQSVCLISPMVVTESLLCLWISWLAGHISSNTIRIYLYGVRDWMLAYGVTCSLPSMIILKRTFIGIRRTHIGNTSRLIRLPITIPILRSMFLYLDLNIHDDRVVWCAMCLAVSIMLRAGEFTSSTTNGHMYTPMLKAHLYFNESVRSHYYIMLAKSKTDKYGVGIKLPVFATYDITCPYTAMWRLMSCYPAHLRNTAPLFTMSNNNPLTKYVFMSRVSQLLNKAGYNSKLFSGHSFRKGGATSMALMGVADHIIQYIGRWRSNAYKLYIQVGFNQMMNASITTSKLINAFGGWSIDDISIASHRDISLFH
jgi:hypothetical protein